MCGIDTRKNFIHTFLTAAEVSVTKHPPASIVSLELLECLPVNPTQTSCCSKRNSQILEMLFSTAYSLYMRPA